MTDRDPATGPLAQGYAKPATPEDIAKDEDGITYPNLHRRINDELTPSGGTPNPDVYYLATSSGYHIITDDDDSILISGTEVTPDKAEYMLLVAGVNSYRYTKREPSEDIVEEDEIP